MQTQTRRKIYSPFGKLAERAKAGIPRRRPTRTATPTTTPTSSRGSSRECRRVVQLAAGQSLVLDASARILARMSVSVSASWNASFSCDKSIVNTLTDCKSVGVITRADTNRITPPCGRENKINDIGLARARAGGSLWGIGVLLSTLVI